MEKNEKNNEISLKTLIQGLLKNWTIIAVITAGALLVGVVYLIFIAKPVYSASIRGMTIVPVKVETPYGIYHFPTTNVTNYSGEVTNEKVLNSTIDSLKLGTTAAELRSRMTITTNQTLNQFSITVKASSTQAAIDQLKKISEAFIQEINVKYRKNAIDTFMQNYLSKNEEFIDEVEKAKVKLAKMQEELSKIPRMILLKSLLTNDTGLAEKVAKENGLNLSALTNETILVQESVNPDYTEAWKAILTAKQALQTAEANLNRNNIRYQELSTANKGVEAYTRSGDISGLTNQTLDVLKLYISVGDSASISSSASFPSKALTLVIALILGMMLGVFFVLFKNYWEYN